MKGDRTLSDAAQQRCRGSETMKTEGFSLESDATVSAGGYSGKRQEFERVHSSIEQLEAQGLKEFKWTGEYVFFCRPRSPF